MKTYRTSENPADRIQSDLFWVLHQHAGHKLVITEYGNERTGVLGAALECVDCRKVIYDVLKPPVDEHIQFNGSKKDQQQKEDDKTDE